MQCAQTSVANPFAVNILKRFTNNTKGVQKVRGKVSSCPYFCKSAEINSYSYKDKHNLYLYAALA